jgi:RNA polymerase II subunit A C-terminal domain phosphatase SSU72
LLFRYDIILTAEERVYDQALEWFESSGNVYSQPAHVVNMDIQDNHEEATIGAFLFCELMQHLADSADLDDEIDEILQAVEAKNNRSILHTVVFY